MPGPEEYEQAELDRLKAEEEAALAREQELRSQALASLLLNKKAKTKKRQQQQRQQLAPAEQAADAPTAPKRMRSDSDA